MTNPFVISMIKGTDKQLVFQLLDQNDLPECLTGASSAVFSVKESIVDTTYLFQTVHGSIDLSKGQVIIDIAAGDTSTLSTGRYIADLLVNINGKAYVTEMMYLDLVPSVNGGA